MSVFRTQTRGEGVCFRARAGSGHVRGEVRKSRGRTADLGLRSGNGTRTPRVFPDDFPFGRVFLYDTTVSGRPRRVDVCRRGVLTTRVHPPLRDLCPPFYFVKVLPGDPAPRRGTDRRRSRLIRTEEKGTFSLPQIPCPHPLWDVVAGALPIGRGCGCGPPRSHHREVHPPGPCPPGPRGC